MKITTFDTLAEMMCHFGFTNKGIIVEKDIDAVESECDAFERKRRDAEVLTTLAANCGEACLEIGTSHGRGTAEIAFNNKQHKTYTVNLLPEQLTESEKLITHLLSKDEIGTYYRGLNLRNVEQVFENTTTWKIPGHINNLGLVFIDGNHDTEAVYCDSQLVYDRVRDGGFILWHDFSPALQSKYEWIDAVMTGVERFINNNFLDVEIFHLRNSWIGFMRKPAVSAKPAVPCTFTTPSAVTNPALTDKDYWSTKHAGNFSPWTVTGAIFSSILEQHLPVNPSFTCAEIGAYPGSNLCYMAKKFRYKPVAIEFSDYTDNIRLLFEHNGISSYEIINKDVLQVTGKQYDVVTSFGFIEHFENYNDIISKHFELTKPGGYIVISVPRFDGFQGELFRTAFEEGIIKDMFDAHNLTIMDLNELKHSVLQFTDSVSYCSYTNDGILYYDWTHPNLRDDKRWLIHAINKLSNLVENPSKGDRFLSPHVLLVAKKPAHTFSPTKTVIGKHLDAASRKLAEADYTGATSALKTCVEKFPEYLDGHIILAELQLETNQKLAAEQTLLNALEIHPQRHEIIDKLHAIYTAWGDRQKLQSLMCHTALWYPPKADTQNVGTPTESSSSLSATSGSIFPHSYPVSILERNDNIITCTANGNTWKLDVTQFVDREILTKGLFEEEATYWVSQIVKEGMTVLDVGANFGYFTVQVSKLVGPSGKVYAFEPSSHFHARLVEHLKINECNNVSVNNYGLSDSKQTLQLFLDDSTASVYWHDDAKKPVATETIWLETLDDFVAKHNLERIDFIKIDIDGSEPKFLAGGEQTLRRFKPILLIEFAQLVLMAAGSDVPRLAEQIRTLGYSFYSEKTGQLFSNEAQFLREAMNCSHSVNIICLPDNR